MDGCDSFLFICKTPATRRLQRQENRSPAASPWLRLNRSHLYLGLLERTGRGQSQIHSVLENIQSNSLCEERALSWGESFEELG